MGELAYNLWWSWNPEAEHLFRDLDNDLWEQVGHNPIRLLRLIERSSLNAAALRPSYLSRYESVWRTFEAYLYSQHTWAEQQGLQGHPIAYFSMEYGLHETLPIYSGGLGVLAGDHLKEASDLGLNLVGVGLLYMEGYFSQRISEDGWQEAINQPLDLASLPLLPVLDENGKPRTVSVEFPDHSVLLRIWEVRVGRVPLYLLDANLEVNRPEDRLLTARLYWSDMERRIMQEVLLGIGGVRALRLLGYQPATWHMNEGHAAFLTLERLREYLVQGLSFEEASARVRSENVFTTHTPVPAGNDEFPLWLIDKYLTSCWSGLGLTREQFMDLARHKQPWGESFSMGVLALRFSGKRNAVSELHGRVTRRMWHFLWPELPEEEVPITYVTNGVHVATWMGRRLRLLLDEFLGEDWLEHVDDPALWDRLEALPIQGLWEVRLHMKRRLVFYLRERVRERWRVGGFHPVQVVASGVLLNPYALTIGFARRFATYKRANLLFSDVERLLRLINRPNMPVQIIFAGKAHPADEPGKQLIQQIYRQVKRAETAGRLVFLEDYDMNLARYLVQGVDLWLNTPRRPMEASGTSGMKAALNGVLNCSVLDGWWREAYNGRNGWAIGDDRDYDSPEAQDAADAQSLYSLLENEIVPLYYERDGRDVPQEWLERVKESMRSIIPTFNTRRMLKEYLQHLYLAAQVENQQ
uniref:glycogen phosphorylase n=1 Tax=uncultured Chloroflexota bacterium TaxID=166587 RepID=H5SBH8_9CHLR|nr:starch phosphorylase [uncultured Chloroflexota bacterium]